MYAELGEDANGAASFDASAKIETNGEHTTKNGKTKIKKNSDLRKSLMDDGEGQNNDLESGRRKRFPGNSSLMSSDDDPYYVFKEDLLMKLELVDDGLQRYERLVKNTDTSVNGAEVKDAKKQLKRHIKHAESTLRDLQTTVRMVEKKRDTFHDIDDAELYERTSFTESCTDRIKEAKNGMNAQAIKTKFLKDERAKSKRRLGIADTKSEDEETSFIANNHADSQLMMEKQDETLDELDDAVVRVGYMAENIHEELGQQNKMLGDLEDDLDNAEEQLGLVMGKLAKIMKTKSKLQLGTIVALSAIVLVLLFLVLYT